MVEWKRQWYHGWKKSISGKRSRTISSWKRQGLIESREFMEQIYHEYFLSEECELCGEPYSEHNKKSMDHCHKTGKFRNVVCHRCNIWKSDKPSKFIYWCNTDKKYVVRVMRNYKKVIYRLCRTEEEAKEILNKFKEDHPYYFT